MYLRLLTMSVIALIGIFIYFQIIKPLINDTRLFPFFSEKEKIQEEIREVKEAIEIQEEKQYLEKLKTQSSERVRKEGEKTDGNEAS